MKIEVTKTTTTQDLKDQFHHYFPHLKFEFFNKSHGKTELNSLDDIIPNDIPIRAITREVNEGVLQIDENTVTGDLEQLFKDTFNLNIQVFRKQSGVWVETCITDYWTLGEQEQTAIEMQK